MTQFVDGAPISGMFITQQVWLSITIILKYFINYMCLSESEGETETHRERQTGRGRERKSVSRCLCSYEYSFWGGQKRVPDPLQLELQVFVRYLMWILRTELRSSLRAVHVTQFWAFLSSPELPFLQLFHFQVG